MQEAELLDALRRLGAYDGFTDKDRSWAARVQARLETPVQVALLGPQDRHIHALIELLLGERLPALPPAPITLRHGPALADLAVLSCGSCAPLATHQGALSAIVLERPAEFLTSVALTILPWQVAPVYGEIDIAIWCSDGFTSEELSLWEPAPNILKDHSFLLASAPAAPEVTEVEFLAFYQTEDAATAPNTYASVARDLRARVESGRAADLDNAALFVETHRDALAAAPPVIERVAPAPVAPQSPPPERDTSPVASPGFDAALNLLRQDASYMLSAVDAGEDQAFDAVLEQCSETGQALLELFENEAVEQVEPALSEEVLSCADRLVLLSLEGGEEPAIEAVTTLLQLKLEFEGRRAA
ncbi:MAG: hypothetical protein AAF340_01315 [Pseudomonadota bacterium]